MHMLASLFTKRQINRRRTHWSISGEKPHPNISEKLSVSDQVRSQILGKVRKMIPVKDQLLGQIWDQNQMIFHILNQETFQQLQGGGSITK